MIADSSMSTSVENSIDDEDAYLGDLPPRQWGNLIMKRVKEASKGDTEAYLAHIGGEKQCISTRGYEFLLGFVQEGQVEIKTKDGHVLSKEEKPVLHGPLRHANLYVDKTRTVVIHKTNSGFKQPPLMEGKSRFAVLCVLAREPDRIFQLGGLRRMIVDDVEKVPDNVSDAVTDLLHGYNLPLNRVGWGRVKIEDETKVCFLERL